MSSRIRVKNNNRVVETIVANNTSQSSSNQQSDQEFATIRLGNVRQMFVALIPMQSDQITLLSTLSCP